VRERERGRERVGERQGEKERVMRLGSHVITVSLREVNRESEGERERCV